VTGRWPSRDPIEEWGGLNIYAFNYNAPYDWFDYLGREPNKPTLTIEFRRDKSIPDKLSLRDQILWDSQINSLKENIACCCEKWPKTCINIKFRTKIEKLEEPEDKSYDRGEDQTPAIDEEGVVPVILTNNDLDGPKSGVGGYASEGRGVILDIHSPGYVLSHELGHSGGYKGNDPDDPNHDKKGKDPTEESIMGPNGGLKVTKQWCERIAKLAKKP